MIWASSVSFFVSDRLIYQKKINCTEDDLLKTLSFIIKMWLQWSFCTYTFDFSDTYIHQKPHQFWQHMSTHLYNFGVRQLNTKQPLKIYIICNEFIVILFYYSISSVCCSSVYIHIVSFVLVLKRTYRAFHDTRTKVSGGMTWWVGG